MYDKGCLAEGHREAAISVSLQLQKFNQITLASKKCVGSSNIENVYQSCKFGYFWYFFLNTKSPWSTYKYQISWVFSKIIWHHTKLCKTLKSYGFTFSKNSHLTAFFVTLGQKEGGIFLSLGNHDRWLSPQRICKVKHGFIFW